MTNFVTIEGRVLARTLADILPIVLRRVPVPILGCVELAVAGSTLKLTACDMDIEVEQSLDVIDASGKWSVAIPPHVLVSIARLAGAAELVIQRTDSGVSVTIDQDTIYQLEGWDSEAFPRIGGKRGRLLETFGNGRLGELLDKVRWAVSTEETRYYLNGVAWLWRGGVRRFAATDGHRLAFVRCGTADEDADRVIPTKAVSFLRGMGPSVALYDIVEQSGSATRLGLWAEAPGVVVRMRLVEMSPTHGYPDIDRVTPKAESFRSSFAVKQVDLMDGIRRALVLDDRKGGGRCLTIANDGGRVTIGGKRHDVGTARVAIRSAWPDGAETFGVNGRYLADIVRHCVGDMTIHQIDAGAPITVLDEDEAVTRVIMPMRV